MCHNSTMESEQIDKCIENGMPTKIIKTLKHTMRKRIAEAVVVNGNEKENDSYQRITSTDLGQYKQIENKVNANPMSSRPFQMQCPFGHGLGPSTNSPYAPPVGSTDLQISNLYGDRRQSNGGKHLPSNVSSVDSIANLSGHDGEIMTAHANDDEDILAKSTQFTRKLTFHMQQAIGRLQKSRIYTLLTKTTQPAHVLAIGILSFVLLTVWPELIDGRSSSISTTTQQHAPTTGAKDVHHTDSVASKNYTLALIVYLGAFSTHFGAQIWMTFVSGLSLYFSLPRHMFGQCQQILFPKYFAMNGVLSITMLILFVKYFVISWSTPQCIQLVALSMTGAIEVLVRLYLAPPLLHLMHEKYKIEGTIGSGKEVGSLVQGDLVQCPHYQRIHKAFRRIHMTVAIGNLITMAASCLHLYYIASQIHISM